MLEVESAHITRFPHSKFQQAREQASGYGEDFLPSFVGMTPSKIRSVQPYKFSSTPLSTITYSHQMLMLRYQQMPGCWIKLGPKRALEANPIAFTYIYDEGFWFFLRHNFSMMEMKSQTWFFEPNFQVCAFMVTTIYIVTCTRKKKNDFPDEFEQNCAAIISYPEVFSYVYIHSVKHFFRNLIWRYVA